MREARIVQLVSILEGPKLADDEMRRDVGGSAMEARESILRCPTLGVAGRLLAGLALVAAYFAIFGT